MERRPDGRAGGVLARQTDAISKAEQGIWRDSYRTASALYQQIGNAGWTRAGAAERTLFLQIRCPADLDRDGEVGFDDVLAILSAWGPYEPCPPAVPEDIDHDCQVGFSDLLIVLANWGPCP